jgi:hypothetical protein
MRRRREGGAEERDRQIAADAQFTPQVQMVEAVQREMLSKFCKQMRQRPDGAFAVVESRRITSPSRWSRRI